ncbi:hypothetical protein TUM20984_17780 [Mycobacterium antarcticum]|nr:hypothetical protein TUM20984_17780 [Mycolicibacterium sp. TUM20984]
MVRRLPRPADPEDPVEADRVKADRMVRPAARPPVPPVLPRLPACKAARVSTDPRPINSGAAPLRLRARPLRRRHYYLPNSQLGNHRVGFSAKHGPPRTPHPPDAVDGVPTSPPEHQRQGRIGSASPR